MFATERFVEDCRQAVTKDGAEKLVRELVTRAVEDIPALMRAIGEPDRAGVHTLYRSPELTVLNLVWGPRMTLLPHNHNRMWAVIGLYSGREDNIFWRRLKDDPDGRIEAAGAKSLGRGEVAPLGPDIIHSVTNPTDRCTGALHVYGGDFFGPGRSEWDPLTLSEQPYDTERNLRRFEESNALLEMVN